MEKSGRFISTWVAVTALLVFSEVAVPCHGEELHGQNSGSTFVTLGLELGMMLLPDLRAGMEYRSLAGPGFEVAVGTNLVMLFVGARSIITGEALAILPLVKLGRSGALDIMLGLPALMWGSVLGPGVYASVGGAARLRFELGSRWVTLARAGGGYLFNIDSEGFRAGSDTDLKTSFFPDLEISAAFRL
jgi:hypothetical protein